MDEIRSKDYMLSINKYKEVEREIVEYEPSDIILERIENKEKEIISALQSFREKYMNR